MPTAERVPLLARNDRESRRKDMAAATILLLIFLERVAFYSLTSNFYYYLTRREGLQWSPDNAMMTYFIFSGVGPICCLVGGVIADLCLNKFAVIVIGFTLFSGSYLFLPFTSGPDGPNDVTGSMLCRDFPSLPINDSVGLTNRTLGLTEEACAGVVLPVVLVAAIGSGLAKGNIIAFGAEHVHLRGGSVLRTYIGWLFWFINFGATLAILGFSYIQEFYYFFYGYLFPGVIIVLATLILIFSYSIFTIEERTKTFKKIFWILKEARESNKRFKSRQTQIQDNEGNSVSSHEGISWLDMAKADFGGIFHEAAVEDVKAIGTILKVFLFIIPYWILYYQMQSTFLKQGLNMRFCFTSTTSNDPTEEYKIPAAWLGLFEGVVLIFFLPFISWFERRYLRLPLFPRILVGMVFACFAMCSAAVVDHYRYTYIESGKTTMCIIHKEPVALADISIFWQIPQYSFMGISEIFLVVTGIEFAFSQSPSSMQGAIMGLFYFMSGVASFLGLAIITIFQYILCKYSSECCNYDSNGSGDGCNMVWYFVFLAVLQIIFVVPFYFVSSHLRIRRYDRACENMYGSSESRVNMHGSERYVYS